MNTSIIFLNPDCGDDETRRQVRSRAAQFSHRVGPRKPKSRSKSSKSRPRQKTKDANEQSASLEEPRPGISRRCSAISIASSAVSATSAISSGSIESFEDVRKRRTPSIPRLGSYTDDPFDSYPVPAQDWFPSMLDYLWQFMLRGWRVLHTTSQERDEAMLWVRQLTMRDPAYFYMNMLSVVGDLVQRGQRTSRDLVWLTGEVVSSINQALSDRNRALAVGTILAVGRLALREIVVGDINSGSTFHRPAFARMIVMAGGLDALGLPSLVRSHLAWADRLMTKKTGVKLAELEPGLANEPTFGGVAADAKDDTRVLDEYLPCRNRQPDDGSDDANAKNEKTDAKEPGLVRR